MSEEEEEAVAIEVCKFSHFSVMQCQLPSHAPVCDLTGKVYNVEGYANEKGKPPVQVVGDNSLQYCMGQRNNQHKLC